MRTRWRLMGLVPGSSGEIRKDMASAQLAIDSFAFVLGKVDSTLEDWRSATHSVGLWTCE